MHILRGFPTDTMDSSIPKDEDGIACVYHEWQNCDGETLGKLFSPSQYSRLSNPDEAVEKYVREMEERSTETRKILRCQMNVSYGEKSSQIIDLYLPQEVKEETPVLVHFHGGYWHLMSPATHGLVSRHLVPLGAIVALVGYTLAPQGSLPEMIQECRDAVAFCARRYSKSRGIYVSGHSAGGHLTMMMLATDWEKQYGLSPGLIKGAVPMSPLFDLRPLVTTYINEPLGLTSDSALECSPIAHLPQIVKNCQYCRLLFIYGDHEPPSFKVQCQQFIKLLKERGVDAPFIEVEKADHFELVSNMINETDQSVKALQGLLFPSRDL